MKKSAISLIILAGIFNVLLAQEEYEPTSTGEIVKHTYYTLSYNETHEQANWVYYILTDTMEFGNVDRNNNFQPDNSVSTGTACDADYYGTGYDRGHMCPAEAMSFNETAMSESFFYSNMSPQTGSLNTGKWRSLENKVREWANEKGQIHVVTGPIFKKNIDFIGPNAVTVPGYFYKIIYSSEGDGAMIAFVFPNKKANKSLEKYIVTVDWVEKMTGIDFFHSMRNRDEKELEKISDPAKWGLRGGVVTKPPNYLKADNNSEGLNGDD